MRQCLIRLRAQVPIPEGLTALDLDTIRLTAQFVARNGKAFLTGLAAREHGNPHFNFLKPTHSLFGFFTGLCDAYSRVLMPPKGLAAKLARNSQDRCARRGFPDKTALSSSAHPERSGVSECAGCMRACPSAA